jgi:cyclic beta-1,2-glucan synthetase
MLNPIAHAANRDGADLYKVEPYVVAADVYASSAHVGRGGWTWYTGAAGWMYRAGLEWILGCRLRGEALLLDPCVPRAWPGFEVRLRYRATHYEISVENPGGVSRGLVSLLLDGKVLPAEPGLIPLVDDGSTHRVRAVLG